MAVLLAEVKSAGFRLDADRGGFEKNVLRYRLAHNAYDIDFIVQAPQESEANRAIFNQAIARAEYYARHTTQVQLSKLGPLESMALAHVLPKGREVQNFHLASAYVQVRTEHLLNALKRREDLDISDTVDGNVRVVSIMDKQGRRGLPKALGTAVDKPMVFGTGKAGNFARPIERRLTMLLKALIVRDGKQVEAHPLVRARALEDFDRSLDVGMQGRGGPS